MTTKTTTYGIPGRAGFRSEIRGEAGSACVVVRRFLLILLLSAFLTPLSSLFSACGHEELVPPDVYVEETVPYVEVRIAIPVANPTGTRANPMGGEEGNGRERGILNEDKIHDVNVYFYRNEQGMNGEGAIDFHLFYNIKNPNDYQNTKVDSVFETSPKFGEKYLTLKFQYWKDGANISETKGMKFLAIANAGDLGEKETLKELRDFVLSRDGESSSTWQTTYDAFSKDASKMDYFLMTTAYDEEYFYDGQSTGKNTIIEASNGDYTGTTTLQRMYARLDLWYNQTSNAVLDGTGDNAKVKELKYDVLDAAGNTVYISNVLPVNVMQTPSYLFKKVTNFGADWNNWSQSALAEKETEEESTPSLFKWGGKESPTDGPFTGSSYNDYPTNYVMERHTTQKDMNGGGAFETWYGNTAKSKVKESIVKDLKNENSNIDNGKLSAYFHMIRYSGDSDPNYDCDHISIISYANENTHPTDCFHSNYLTGMAFRAVYVPKNIYTGHTMTTSTDEEGKTVTTTTLHELDQSVTSINGGKIYRYSPTAKDQKESQSLYFTDREKAEEYAQAHPGDMAIISEGYPAQKHTLEDGSEKWGFVCYYNLWLRHYNNEADDPQATYPMEYATVRNNIYRVSVSFRGPGDPTPTMREPDTMKARIFVRKWNYREEDEFVFKFD